MENFYSSIFYKFLVATLLLVGSGTMVYSHFSSTSFDDIPLQVDHMSFTQCARTAELRVRGGLPPYQYVWQKDGVEVQVDIIADGSMSILSMAQSGTYTVTVFDNSSPIQQLTQTFNFVDSRNFQYDLDFEKDHYCEGQSYGKIVGNIVGGAAPFAFNLYGEHSSSPVFSESGVGRDVNLNEIPSGAYTLEIIDNSGCREILEVVFEEIETFELALDNIHPEDCDANGAFSYFVENGGDNIQYRLFRITSRIDGADHPASSWVNVEGNHVQVGSLVSGLYELHVIDEYRREDCPEKISIEIPDWRRIEVGVRTSPVTCFGGNDGNIILDFHRINRHMDGQLGPPQNLRIYRTPPGGTEIHDPNRSLGLGNNPYWEYENMPSGIHKFRIVQGGNQVTDCWLHFEVEVMAPEAPISVGEISSTPVSCFDGTDGTATVIAEGGWGGFTYKWNDPAQQETPTAKNLRAGTYEVTVRDKEGCEEVFSVEVVGPPGLIQATFNTDPATCVGTADGNATVTASGGWGGPYTYLWSNGQEGQTATNLPPGENFVLITDDKGCTQEFPFNVPIAEVPGVEVNPIAPICYAQDNGEIHVRIDNDEHNYLTTVNGETKAGNNIAFNNLSPGTYEVIISYGNGCEIIEWATVPDILELRIDNSELRREHVLCYGEETGSITGVRAVGGNGGYQYEWRKNIGGNFVKIEGEEQPDIFGIGAGSYRLYVTDAKGCSLYEVYTINQPGEFKLVDKTFTDASCFGSRDGSAAIVISGGVAPYTYSFNGGTEVTTPNVLLSIPNLPAGEGNVIQIRDANNCQLTPIIFEIEQPDEIIIEKLELQPESCFNGRDGFIHLDISGGSGDLDIRWTRRGSNSTIGTEQEIDGLGPGEYVVRVRDLNNPNCEVTREYTIEGTPELLAVPTIEHILCFGEQDGAINLDISGGTLTPGEDYFITWEGPDGFSSVEPNISGLKPGTYSVTILDSKSCQFSMSNLVVREPAGPVEINLINAVNPSCHNGTNGRIEVNLNGGTGVKTISWYKFNGSTYEQVPGTTSTLAGLAPGKYMAEVVDQNGCVDDLEIELINPDPLTITVVEETNPTCFGVNDGSIKIDVQGGSGGPYNYSWSHGSSRQDPVNLGGGTYTVTVRDGYGCEVTSEEITLVEPAQLGITVAAILDPQCFGSPSHIEVNLLGGIEGQRNTKWTNLTTEAVVAEGEGINKIENLTPGFYELRYSNNGFCELVRIFQVRGPSEALELVIDMEANSCGPESIALFAKGGIPTYRFEYFNGTDWVRATNAVISSLNAGDHEFRVVDSKGCKDEKTITLTDNAPAFVHAEKVQDISCWGRNDGEILYEIRGATQYSWLKSAGGSNWEVVPGYDFIDTNEGEQRLPNLTEGFYKLRVFYNEDDDCFEDSEDIVIIEPIDFELVKAEETQPVCWDENGTFVISVDGGNEDKRIILTYPDNTFQTIEDVNNRTDYIFTDLPSGDYSFVVEDVNCDPLTGSFHIESIQRPTVDEVLVDDVTCLGAADGRFIFVNLLVEHGRSYQVFVNGSSETPMVEGNKLIFGPKTPGRYIVNIVDALGCSSEDFVIDIEEPERELEITSFVKTDITCYEAGDGKATFEIFGGRETYHAVLTKVGDNTFSEEIEGINEGNPVVFDGLEVGDYHIEVTDQQENCLDTQTFTINTPDPFIAQENFGLILCLGGTTFIEVNLSGGIAPFDVKYFSLNENGDKFGEFSHLINGNRSVYNNVGAGTYVYEITDRNGCLVASESPIVIAEGQELEFTFTAEEETCYNGFNGQIEINAEGSNDGEYIYYVNNRAYTNSVINGLGKGEYQVYVMNADGCISPVQTVVIDGPEQAFSYSHYSQTNLSCFESGNGTISLQLTGGTAPYTVSLEGQDYTLTENEMKVFEGLEAEKQYNFDVVDANGCALVLFPRTLTQPDELKVTHRFQDILCYGGTTEIQLSVQGGTLPFSVAWEYSQDNVTFTQLSETGRTLSNAYAGYYKYVLTDDKGCEFEDEIHVPQPDLLDFDFDVTDVTCFRGEDGSIRFTPEGGLAGDYRLFVNNREVAAVGGVFEIRDLKFGDYTSYFTRGNCISETKTIRVNQPLAGISVNLQYQEDVRCFEGTTNVVFNIQGGNGIYTAYLNDREITLEGNQIIFDEVPAGNYQLRVVDQKGCDWNDEITITQPEPIQISQANVTQTTCFEGGDGQIDITVTGGTGVIRYQWTNLESGDMIGNTNRVGNLAEGEYEVRIYDDRGCEIFEKYEITAPEEITFEVDVEDVLCFGGNTGSITIKNPQGGRGNYRLVIDGISRTGLSTNNLRAKQTYQVWLMDGTGVCSSDIIEVEIKEPPLLTVSATGTPETCYNANDGTAALTIAGGAGGAVARWSDGGVGPLRTNLYPGMYQYEVTDINGCRVVGSVRIERAEPIQVDSQISNILCFGESTGKIELDITGGTGTYSYEWKNLATGQAISSEKSLTNVSAGDYRVTITDENECTIGRTFTLTQPSQALSVDALVSDVQCHGDTNGEIRLLLEGGTGFRHVRWHDLPTTDESHVRNREELPAGDYTVTVTDANNCQVTETFTVEEPAKLIVTTVAQEDVSCKGGEDGSVKISVEGGAGAPIITWLHNGSRSLEQTGLKAGTYIVNVTDSRNYCLVQHAVEIKEPAAHLAAEVNLELETCGDQNTMIAEVIPSGGNGDYRYEWRFAGTETVIDRNQRALGLAPGDYEVTVIDAKDCDIVKTVTVFDANLEFTATPAPALCFGDATGAITISDIRGGTGDYTWEVNGVEVTTGFTRSGLSAGVYTVTVRDSMNCFVVENEVEVGQPDQLGFAFENLQHETCYLAKNGSVTIVPQGGTGDLNIRWDNNSTSFTRNNLAPGRHTFVITDQNCRLDGEVFIEEATQISLTQEIVSPVLCFGDPTGEVEISVEGGAGGYTFKWYRTSDMETVISEEQNLTGVVAGNYRLHVSDANGCTIISRVYQITQPTIALSARADVTHISCFRADDGQIRVIANGGTGDKTVTWEDTDFEGETRSGLSPGTYKYTVRDKNNCEIHGEETILEPELLVVDPEITAVSCKGGSNGEIELIVTGGSGSYSVIWENSGNSSLNRAGLRAGSYTYTVSDGKCEVSNTVEIAEPEFELSAEVVVRLETCGEQSSMVVEVTAQGGNGNYTYTWSEPSWTGSRQEGVQPGSYSVTVEDVKGCEITKTFDVYDANITFTATPTVVLCHGGNTGSITLSDIKGGVSPYKFFVAGVQLDEGSFRRSGLVAGTYKVVVEDANECREEIEVVIDQPEQIGFEFETLQHETCFSAGDGVVEIRAFGGVGELSIVWDNGNRDFLRESLSPRTHTFRITDENQCFYDGEVTIQAATQMRFTQEELVPVLCHGDETGGVNISVSGGRGDYSYNWYLASDTQRENVISTDRNLANVEAGSYLVVVTDLSGCSIDRTFQVTQPAAKLAASHTFENISCFMAGDGWITVSPSGGTGIREVSWEDTDVKGATRTGLEPGTYKYTVTDANLCTTMGQVTITEPTELTVTPEIKDVTCKGMTNGEIELKVEGGSGDYSVIWENSGNKSLRRTGLAAGTYTYTVSDGKCEFSETITIEEPELDLTAQVVANLEACGEQSSMVAEVTPIGGNGGYLYEWRLKGSLEVLFTDARVEGIPAGEYEIKILDAKECFIIEELTVFDANLRFEASATDVSCHDGSNGTISISNRAGGIGSYKWFVVIDNQEVEVGSGLTRGGLKAGTYKVILEDAMLCRVEQQVEIKEPEALGFTSSVRDQSCFNVQDGRIEIIPSGGVGNYSIVWDDPAGNDFIRKGLVPNRYTFTLYDTNNESQCNIKGEIFVQGATQITIESDQIQHVLCHGDQTGGVNLVDIQGGTGGYDFKWVRVNPDLSETEVATSRNLAEQKAGRYKVYVNDGNGCTINKTFTITQPDTELSVEPIVFDASCYGKTDGSIRLIASGGFGTKTVKWADLSDNDEDQGKFERKELSPGTYEATVTDQNNCSITEKYTIENPEEIVIKVIEKRDVLCHGEKTGMIEIEVTGGSGNFVPNWGPFGQGYKLENLAAGDYMVTIFDGNCQKFEIITIEQPARRLEAEITVKVDICGDSKEIYAEVEPDGGVGPYTFQWNDAAQSTTAKVVDLAPGTYKVVITDNNGCWIEKEVVMPEPKEPMTLTLEGKMSVCFNGDQAEIEAQVEGGSGDFEFKWSHSSTLIGNKATNLNPGTYIVRAIDKETGCWVEENYYIVPMDQKIVRQAALQNVSCEGVNDGTVTYEMTGYQAPFTVDLIVNDNVIRKMRFTEDVFTIDQLSPRGYAVKIEDALECSVNRTFTIEAPQPLKISENRVTQHISCHFANDGRIFLPVTGGIGSYVYEWQKEGEEEIFTTTLPERKNLGPGIYSVTVSSGACSITEVIEIIEPPLLEMTEQYSEMLECNGSLEGFIHIDAKGGWGTREIFWSDDEDEKSYSRSGLPAGVYEVRVEDENGCYVEKTITIEEPEEIDAYLTTSLEVDCEERTVVGKAYLTVTGGTGEYQINWSNGEQNVDEISFTQDGKFSVTILDENGCMEYVETVIEFPPSFATADFSYTVIETQTTNGEVLLGDHIQFNDLSLGDIVSWEWEFGDGITSNEQEPKHSYAQTGFYTVKLSVVDQFGCTSIHEMEIQVLASYRVLVPNAFTPNGDGLNDTFKPMYRGVEDIEFHIFNKWGDLIYSAYSMEDPGWDGTVRDRMSPNGNYVYKIYFTTKEGDRKSQSGVFLLIN
ncbi:T9SS type B sorting domain-containing protein [Litoribacter populi]|uniref:T9SS type B sorting domain-containing protein n=1 Tax=Litoribacter populi TaxID=2598460 RepID=UPI00163D5E3A|nr:gliding motility-associated C-terminal domain-containing protein [Litoribacter populi]